LNCVQENIIRGGQRDRSRRRPDGSRMPKSRAIKAIDEDMKLNKALWEMAERLRFKCNPTLWLSSRLYEHSDCNG
jgi:hypothetical protein